MVPLLFKRKTLNGKTRQIERCIIIIIIIIRLNLIDPKLGNYVVTALEKHYESRKRLYSGYK